MATPERHCGGEARLQERCFLGADLLAGGTGEAATLQGYEIHMGRITPRATARSPFRLLRRNGQPVDALDGAISPNGNVLGTMLHGLFENAGLRHSLLAELRQRRGLAEPTSSALPSREAEYDRLAAAVRASLDLGLLREIIARACPGA
jgi:adenosylcobyric acid synthase